MKPAFSLPDVCSFLGLRQKGGFECMLGVCWVCAGVVLGMLRSMVRKKTLTLCSVELTLPTLLNRLSLPLIPLEALYQKRELGHQTHGRGLVRASPSSWHAEWALSCPWSV